MAQLSLVERDNGPGFVEEDFLVEITYEASLNGFIRTATLIIGNLSNNLPQVASGTTTSSGGSTTINDTAATFFSDGVQKGDRVTNTSDSNAIWEIAAVDSQIKLTVQLLVSGGGQDDWDSSENYTINRRNSEDVYIPFSTEIRITSRDINKVFFRGQVQESLPQGDSGPTLKVICVSRESELRDSSPQTDVASTLSRASVIQDIIDDKAADTNAFLFPFISSFDGEPGLDYSPNVKVVQPDYSKTSRSALASMLDLAKSDQWCPDEIREPTNPVLSVATRAGETELDLLAQGSLAQSFAAPSNMLLSKVKLFLKRTGSLTGNIYIRIEATDEDGDPAGLDIPSGELISPFAESGLLGASNVITTGDGGLVSFVFPEPVALRSGAIYWITLQYQEDNNNFATGVTNILWQHRVSSISGTQAVYTGGSTDAWAASTANDFLFDLWEHADAVWLWDNSENAWVDLTTEAESTDASRLSWMGDELADRMYIRTAGPIRGLDLFMDGSAQEASVEYGAFTVHYYGDNGAKIVGEHDGSDGASALTDTDKDFRKSGVVTGDVVHNRVDDSYSVVTTIAQNVLTVGTIFEGADQDFDIGDSYAVLGLEQRTTGTQTGGAATTTMTDSAASFEAGGVREGDLIVNVNDNLVSIITAYTATTIVTANDMSWATSDVYIILSRWRTAALLDTEASFLVNTGGKTPRLEWEMPSNAVPTFFEAGKPEAVSPGFTDVEDLRGFWYSIQTASIPGTLAEIDQVFPLPGAGFVLKVTDATHPDPILAAGGVHDGGAAAAFLEDTSEDFIADHDVRVGDTVENLTDGSNGVITAITSTTAHTEKHDRIVATLAGGAGNVWDNGDIYRVLRDRFRVRYYRLGGRPPGLPANFGLTFRQGTPRAKQIWPSLSPTPSQSTWASANRIRVVGRTSGGAVVDETRNNTRAQRKLGRVIVKTVVDYSITTVQEAQDRGDAELARVVDTAEYGMLKCYSLPFHIKTLERASWFAGGTGLQHKLDGSAASSPYVHSTGASAASLQDTSQNFKKWDVEVGDLVSNLDDGAEASITGITTTTNENDTLVGVLAGGGTNDWQVGEKYKVERRQHVEVGDLVRVKVQDPTYIDSDYIVVRLKYHEPSFVCEFHLAKNLNTSAIDSHSTPEEFFRQMGDDSRRALQRAGY